MIYKQQEELTKEENEYLGELIIDFTRGSWIDDISLYNQMISREPARLLMLICYIPKLLNLNVNEFTNSEFYKNVRDEYIKNAHHTVDNIFKLVDDENNSISNKVTKAKKKFREENNKCVCCNKQSKFKNSHTIPRYILENINSEEENKNGNKKILTISNFSSINKYYPEGLGIKRTNCFECICNDCENRLFKYYEQPDLLPLQKFNEYDTLTKNNIMRSIALKTDISSYYFYQIEKNLDLEEYSNYFSNKDEFLSDYNFRIKKLKNNLKNEYQYNKYKILYAELLDYNVGFSIQESINDLGGKGKLDITKGTTYVNVFPLGDKTLILIFINNKYSKKYRDLEAIFKSKTTEEILLFLNYNILLETQHIFFDYNVFKSFKFNEYSQILMNIGDEKVEVSPSNFNYSIIIDRDDILNALGVSENTINNMFTAYKL